MLTQEYLKSIIHYDAESGVFTWRVYKGPASTRTIGTKTKGGYTAISIDYKKYYAHRLAWLYMTGEWPENEIDHIDTDKANNKWINLRSATHKQNQANIKRRKDNTTGIKGVYYGKHVAKWIANISHNGKNINLGCYETKEDAAKAYAQAAKHYHGEYTRTE